MPSRNTNALPAMPRHCVGRPRFQPMRGVYEIICSCGAPISAASRIEADRKADVHHALNARRAP